jgi:hypothetical protein
LCSGDLKVEVLAHAYLLIFFSIIHSKDEHLLLESPKPQNRWYLFVHCLQSFIPREVSISNFTIS